MSFIPKGALCVRLESGWIDAGEGNMLRGADESGDVFGADEAEQHGKDTSCFM